jgi:hypothetical protein
MKVSFDLFILFQVVCLVLIVSMSFQLPEFCLNWLYLVCNLFIIIPLFEILRVFFKVCYNQYLECNSLATVFFLRTKQYTEFYVLLLLLNAIPQMLTPFIIMIYTVVQVLWVIQNHPTLSFLNSSQKNMLVYVFFIFYMCSLPLFSHKDSWWICYVQSFVYSTGISIICHNCSYIMRLRALFCLMISASILCYWGFFIETLVWTKSIQILQDQNKYGVFGIARKVVILPTLVPKTIDVQ